eukprot:TRINITY_DN29891_c0_g2_i1.p1 TRINITY_DN29891_c0_g2~~TRINITY_DN29891_c0_g2_i1.p1  ORF type:complete len:120 (-),score=25.93 TRINITY_DN29891_c0_g2_i1:499-858(-)
MIQFTVWSWVNGDGDLGKGQWIPFGGNGVRVYSRNHKGRDTSNIISKETVSTSGRGKNKTSRDKQVASTVRRIITVISAARRVEHVSSVVLLIMSSRTILCGETKATGNSSSSSGTNSS